MDTRQENFGKGIQKEEQEEIKLESVEVFSQ